MTIAISRRLLSSICVGSPICGLAVDVDLDRRLSACSSRRRRSFVSRTAHCVKNCPSWFGLGVFVSVCSRPDEVVRVQRRDARLVALLRQARADHDSVQPLVAPDCRVVEVDPDPGRDEHRPAVDEHVEVRVHVVLEELGLLRYEARLARQPHRVLGRGPRRLRRARGRNASVLGAVAAASGARALVAASAAAAGERNDRQNAHRHPPERHAATLSPRRYAGRMADGRRADGSAPDQPLDRRRARSGRVRPQRARLQPGARCPDGRGRLRRPSRRSARRSRPRRRRCPPGARSRSRAEPS